MEIMNNSSHEEQQRNLKEFEIDELIRSTYKKIAEWHNDSPSTVGLKHLSIDLIEDIAGKAFGHLGLTYDPALNLDEKTKELLEKERGKRKDVDQMSIEELKAELEKRRNKS